MSIEERGFEVAPTPDKERAIEELKRKLEGVTRRRIGLNTEISKGIENPDERELKESLARAAEVSEGEIMDELDRLMKV